jgi:hypothetical protein
MVPKARAYFGIRLQSFRRTTRLKLNRGAEVLSELRRTRAVLAAELCVFDHFLVLGSMAVVKTLVHQETEMLAVFGAFAFRVVFALGFGHFIVSFLVEFSVSS